MSYEMVYKSAFVKLPNGFIPVFNHGSNNCWETSYSGRDIPEKNWSVFNYKNRDKLIFDNFDLVFAPYLDNLYKAYFEYNKSDKEFLDASCSDWNISRHTTRTNKQVINLWKNAYKNALTVEEYYRYGNSMIVSYHNYEDETDNVDINVTTTDELIKAEMQVRELLVKNNNVGYIGFSFRGNRDIILPKKPKTIKPLSEQKPKNFALRSNVLNGYLVKMGKWGKFWHTGYSYAAKKFTTENEAFQYLLKHHNLSNYSFDVINLNDLEKAA